MQEVTARLQQVMAVLGPPLAASLDMEAEAMGTEHIRPKGMAPTAAAWQQLLLQLLLRVLRVLDYFVWSKAPAEFLRRAESKQWGQGHCSSQSRANVIEACLAMNLAADIDRHKTHCHWLCSSKLFVLKIGLRLNLFRVFLLKLHLLVALQSVLSCKESRYSWRSVENPRNSEVSNDVDWARRH